jgi:hypothetical protein
MKKVFYYFIPIVAICLLIGCNGRSQRKSEDSSQPIDTINVIDKVKLTVNVFIENTVSMDGYINGHELRDKLFEYLSNIEIEADAINIFYINSTIIPQGANIRDFFTNRFNVATFRTEGNRGNRGHTDIAPLFDNILNRTQQNEVSIFVFDGIFSPKAQNPTNYFRTQETNITNSFRNFLARENNATVILYHLSAKFNGRYFAYCPECPPNFERDIGTVDEQRPIYVWLIGNSKHLADLKNVVPQRWNLQNTFLISSGNQQVRYALHPSIGRFTKSRTDPHKTIQRLQVDRRTGKAEFAVNVDFSNLLLDDSYLMDVNNFENNSRYNLSITRSTSSNFTHILRFSSDRVHKGTVSVKLKNNRPGWIDEVNDNDGRTATQGKTFGIKYQADGVFRAFAPETTNNYYTEIRININ